MGVAGRPQSATGQASILTGINAAQRLGEHYGPRPDARVRAVIDEGNLFARLRQKGCSTFFCNGYPERYFAVIRSGKRLFSAIPYAVTSAGQALGDHHDVIEGRAISADFTNQGWRTELGYQTTPLYSPQAAGEWIAHHARQHHLLFFEHWLTDVIGHNSDLEAAVANFQVIDGVLAGLFEAVDWRNTLLIVTSDHGNVEDCSHGKHTENPVLTLLAGVQRQQAAERIHSLADFVPVVEQVLGL
jgi:phosphopentomutase